ncbi:MAG: hypothetical protein WCK38_03840 [Candidatus Omnitrophota bacterium]
MKTMKAAQGKKQALEVREMFMLVDTRQLDSKHRITVGGKLQKLISGKMNIDSYQIFIGKEGDILLRPAVSVPSNEAWVYRNPKVIGRIRQGLKEAAEGATEKVDDLESFLRDL